MAGIYRDEPYTVISHKVFADMANPHSWLLVADNLHEQAKRLQTGTPNGYLTQSKAGQVEYQWPLENRTTFLLAGFALENILKAFLVYENPEWVSNGQLCRKLKSHKLTGLAEKVCDLPWPKRGPKILSQFERGLESWARYPCGLSSSDTEVENVLSDGLWPQYLALMSAYGVALVKKLSAGWSGPHGSGGQWEISGSFLSLLD